MSVNVEEEHITVEMLHQYDKDFIHSCIQELKYGGTSYVYDAENLDAILLALQEKNIEHDVVFNTDKDTGMEYWVVRSFAKSSKDKKR